ncbi:hypothetical protein KUTeg_012987 [Tegillarca granosa]|uniref:Uncharacterized protein n=1 Tax=Tegillarca granosa TaxID=220873 RepID=A0ABQ9EXW3_TEGGR|nr:hypothetical protein KUTeg_012987 [Tegillarca granosa]
MREWTKMGLLTILKKMKQKEKEVRLLILDYSNITGTHRDSRDQLHDSIYFGKLHFIMPTLYNFFHICYLAKNNIIVELSMMDKISQLLQTEINNGTNRPRANGNKDESTQGEQESGQIDPRGKQESGRKDPYS